MIIVDSGILCNIFLAIVFVYKEEQTERQTDRKTNTHNETLIVIQRQFKLEINYITSPLLGTHCIL